MSPHSPPPSQPIRQALDLSEPLARLTQRLQESALRLQSIEPLIPATMRDLVRSGPVDTEGWTLLAQNGAVAAKLRQLLPVLQQHLVAAGWPERPIRVKVLSRP